MNTVTLLTIEGHEVSLSAEDHAKLAGWPRIDLSRLHTINDEVFASVDGKPHAIDLEAMLALMGAPAFHEVAESPSCPLRICRVCKKGKPNGSFTPHSGAPDGLMQTCKTCATKARRARKEFREAAEELAAKGTPTPRPGSRLEFFRLSGQASWASGVSNEAQFTEAFSCLKV